MARKRRRLSPAAREHVDLLALEHLLAKFLNKYSRPNARHEQLEPAYRYVLSYRRVAEAALSGDENAKRLRRTPDDNSDSLAG